MFNLLFSIWLGKLIYFITRTFNFGGGSAAPGLYALKICSTLVTKLTRQIPTNIIITGTNGKTTTSRMVAHFAQASGLKVLRNSTGSNLERGVASALISKVNIFGKIESTDLAVWELDEAAFNTICSKVNPQIIVFLNLFRDQLDRYGEIDTVYKKWCQTLDKVDSDCLILLNGDDNHVSTLSKAFKGSAQKFGVKDYKIEGESIIYKKEAENLDYEAVNIKVDGLNGTEFQLTMNHELLTINLPLPGIYHIYDFLAAFAVSNKLKISTQTILESLTNFSPAFGRVEKLQIGEEKGYIFLIKNPAGTNEVLNTVSPQMKPEDRLLIALNDNLADGTDVSWIWDVNFEVLQNSFRAQSRNYNIICSGTRAYDLALRLKYAGVGTDNIAVIPSLNDAFRASKQGLKGFLFVLPTYTAMLELQAILVKDGIKSHYWKEDR